MEELLRLPIKPSSVIPKMRLRIHNAVSLCALAGLLACSFHGMSLSVPANAPAIDLGTFPPVDATSLDKARLELPRDFGGSLNLVMISFAREQQHEVDTWLPAARLLESEHPKLLYYELPTTAWENLLYRWWFNSALRSNNTDPALTSRILTLYVSKGPFRQSLRIPNEKQIVILLVDRTGHVLWRTEGVFTSEKNQSLQSAVVANGE